MVRPPRGWHSGWASANCAHLHGERPIHPYGQGVRLLQIALGGAVGSLARFGLDQAMPWNEGFPWATLIINVVGALAIGLVATTVVETRPWVRPVVIVGVLGGFTTFSAFALQTGTLLDAGHVVQALVYLALTMVGGLVAVELGAAWGPRLRRVSS